MTSWVSAPAGRPKGRRLASRDVVLVAEPGEDDAALEEQASAELAMRELAALGGFVDGLSVDPQQRGDFVGRENLGGDRGQLGTTRHESSMRRAQVSDQAFEGSGILPICG